jgi:Tfp pilus assembly protein PilO
MADTTAQIAKIKWPQVGLAALGIAVAYFLFVRDDGSRLVVDIKQSQDNLAIAERRLKRIQEQQAQAEAFRKQIDALEQKALALKEILPVEFSSTDLVRVVTEQAAASGVQLTSASPVASAGVGMSMGNEPYETFRITFTLNGSFSNIMQFLANMSRAKQMISFERADLKVESSPASPDRPGVVFTAILVGYRFKPAPSPSPSPAG